MLNKLNDSQITKEEVQEAVMEIRAGKTAGLDGCIDLVVVYRI